MANFLLIAEFPSLPEELESDVKLQKLLDNITPETVSDVEKIIFSHSKNSINWVLKLIYKISTIRHKNFNIYAYLCLKIIINYGLNVYAFPIARVSVSFVRKFYQLGIFSTQEIQGFINAGDKVSNFPFKEYVDINFTQVFNEVVIPYESDYIKYQYTKDSLAYIIYNDLIDDFQNYVKIHPDYQKQSIYLVAHHVAFLFYNSVPPLAAAAFYCAEKIFDFMILQGCVVDETIGNYAVLGGNMSIIKICKSCGCFFSDGLKYATIGHRSDVFNWLLKRCFKFPDAPLCAKSCNIEVLLYIILQKGVDINQPDNRSRTCLQFACRHLSLNMIKFLIERKADPYKECDRSLNALHNAARYDRFDAIKYLVEQLKMDLDARVNTPLSCALSSSNPEIIKYVVDLNKESINKPSFRFGVYPIDTAAMLNDIKTMKLIKEYGGEMNGVSMGLLGTCINSLIFAIQGGFYDACRYLIENGADVNAKTISGKNVYYYAAKRKDIELLKLFKSRNVEMNGIEMVAAGRSTTIMTWLLRNGSKFNENYHKNAYHNAAQYGTVRELDFIYRNSKLDIRKKDKSGRTPLHYAACLPYFAPKFLENVNVKKDKQRSIEKVKYMLAHGSKIDDIDEDGANVIWRAVYSNNEELCEFLLEEWIKRGFTNEQLINMRSASELSLYEYMKANSIHFDCIEKLFNT